MWIKYVLRTRQSCQYHVSIFPDQSSTWEQIWDWKNANTAKPLAREMPTPGPFLGSQGSQYHKFGHRRKKYDKRKIESLFNGKGPLATQHVCYSPPWACEKSKGFRQDYHWHALKNGKILIRYQLLTQPDQILGWYYPCRCQTRS